MTSPPPAGSVPEPSPGPPAAEIGLSSPTAGSPMVTPTVESRTGRHAEPARAGPDARRRDRAVDLIRDPTTEPTVKTPRCSHFLPCGRDRVVRSGPRGQVSVGPARDPLPGPLRSRTWIAGSGCASGGSTCMSVGSLILRRSRHGGPRRSAHSSCGCPAANHWSHGSWPSSATPTSAGDPFTGNRGFPRFLHRGFP
jgi:hypothetical protein